MNDVYIEAIVIRRTAGMEFKRLVFTNVERLSEAADAIAREIGFPSWDHYSRWCESPPFIYSIKVRG